MMQHWDPVASSLPDVVQRLLTLRDLHEEGEGLEEMLGTVAWHDKEHAGGGGGGRSPAALSFYLPPSHVVHAGPGILGDHAAGDGCCSQEQGLAAGGGESWKHALEKEWVPSCLSHSSPAPLTPLQVQKMLKENLAIVGDNFSSLKARIKQLQQ